MIDVDLTCQETTTIGDAESTSQLDPKTPGKNEPFRLYKLPLHILRKNSSISGKVYTDRQKLEDC
jgi:hypothetical protein